jgi:hypothetical protein
MLWSSTTRATALLPVDLVGPYAGLELAAEQAREAGVQDRDRIAIDQTLGHDEAVLAEARHLVLAECDHRPPPVPPT